MKNIITLCTALCLLFACSEDDEPTNPPQANPPNDPPELASITLAPAEPFKLDLGEYQSIKVTGTDQFGDEITITNLNWESDFDGLTVDQAGMVTAIEVGTGTIKAVSGGVEASVEVTAWDSSAPRIEIYVSDVGVNRNGPHIIFKYDEDGSFPVKYITQGLARPQDIVFLEDQNLVLVSNLQTNNITQYDINTGEQQGVFASNITSPTRMEIGPDGKLYVAYWAGGPIERFELDGTPLGAFTTSSINQAIGLAWDKDNNLYVSSFNNGANGFVKKFDANGEDQGNFVATSLAGPTDIWFDSDGDLFVNDWSSSRVVRFNSSGEFKEVYISSINQPEGVDIFRTGELLLGASGTGSVKMYRADGSLIKDVVRSGSGGLTTPNAVTVRYVNQ